MHKKWMIGGAVVLVVAGAMPWAVGYVTEQQWQHATLEVNSAQPFVQLETSDYRRGFLGAELSGSLVLINPETGESYRVGYHGNVSHGVTGSLLNFEPVDGWAPAGADWFPEELPALTLETRLWGQATMDFHIPVTRINDAETGETLATSGGLIRVEVSGAGDHVQALIDWPEITVNSSGHELRVAGLHVHQDMDYLTGDIWTGKGSVEFGSAVIASDEMPPLTVQGFSVVSSSEARAGGQRLDSRVTANLESLSFDQDSYGPHHIVFALDNLDVASWNHLSEGLSDLQAQTMPGAGMDTADFEQQMAAMMKVGNAARDLAAAGFSVSFPELSLDTPEGEVTGDLVITHPELSADEKSEMLMVMQRLTGEMNLSLPAALAENYPDVNMQVAPLIKQGLLVQEGDRLMMKASMKDLQVNVNDVAMPLPPVF